MHIVSSFLSIENFVAINKREIKTNLFSRSMGLISAMYIYLYNYLKAVCICIIL